MCTRNYIGQALLFIVQQQQYAYVPWVLDWWFITKKILNEEKNECGLENQTYSSWEPKISHFTECNVFCILFSPMYIKELEENRSDKKLRPHVNTVRDAFHCKKQKFGCFEARQLTLWTYYNLARFSYALTALNTLNITSILSMFWSTHYIRECNWTTKTK